MTVKENRESNLKVHCTMQFSVMKYLDGIMCLWLHFKYFIWFDIPTLHAWIKLAVALAYVLMYYYGTKASSIRRDWTISLSFIIINVWLLESQNAMKFYLKRSKISKFSEGMLSNRLVLACLACKCTLHTIEVCISYKTSKSF